MAAHSTSAHVTGSASALAAAGDDGGFHPDEIRAFMRAQTLELLCSRSRATVWTIVAGLGLFLVAKRWFEPSTSYLWYAVAFAHAAMQCVMLALLRPGMSISRLELIMLADTAAACAVIAWLGIASGRTTGADFFLLGVGVNTAALLPWAPRFQATLGTIAALAIVATGYGVNGTVLAAVDLRTFVPAVVLIGASVYTSYMLEAARLQTARADLLRQRAEEETRGLNGFLERRVAERTTELRAANDELEAFAYSVSHDLRAPLRAMDGFSEALLEDYSANLDDGAKEYLRRIRGEASRLGDLVDELLRLSRVTRAVMQRSDVDLSAIASTVAAQLRASHPDRAVQFKIEAGLRDHCDASLVRVLLENLLGNAFKFTRRNPDACIEFRCEKVDEDRIYVVRDNGVGFDMAHVGKVFAAFERLHRSEDFEGTGIGLTTVDRIVRRHGGAITAESEPDKGATFRFTLCPKGESS